MTPLLKKLLAISRRSQRASLLDATAVIQRALGGTVARKVVEPKTDRRPAATGPIVTVLDEAPASERRTAPRFSEAGFTAATGTRRYKLFEPAGFDGQALPLLVMLHGCTQDPDDFAAGTRMNALAQAQGFFVLYPAQAPRSNSSKCWNWFVPGDQRRGLGEPALIAALVEQVIETHAVDVDRVFVAGLSAGGAMAAILAREYPDLFAAAGVHSGLAPGAAHDVASAFAAMKSGGPTPVVKASRDPAGRGAPVIAFHGDADGTVHAANLAQVVAAALGHVEAPATKETVAAAPGCRAYTRTVFADSLALGRPDRAESWLVRGGAHAWFGGAPAGSYTDAQGPDASKEMLRFFREHPRRRDA